MCIPCSTNCLYCSANDPSVCTKCAAISNLYLLNDSCVTSCPSKNYYTDTTNRLCIPCKLPCEDCINAADYCTSCTSKTGIFYYLVQGQCLSLCPSQYYGDPVNKTCIACQSPCLNCSSTVDCLSCRQSGAVLYQQRCL